MIFTLSMTGRALGFERVLTSFIADYSVQVTLTPGDGAAPVSLRDAERVRVGSVAETRRTDEMIIFQRALRAGPGRYEATITVVDDVRSDSATARGEVVVPPLGPGEISTLLPVYVATARTSRGEVLEYVANPRSTVTFGYDTAYFYLEGYDLAPETIVDLWLADSSGSVLWRDGLTFGGGMEVEGVVIGLTPDILDVGELVFNAQRRDQGVLRQAPLVVSFAAQWVGTDLDGLLSLLRYAPWREAIDTLREAEAGRKVALWRQFWEVTDPNDRTPENEFLEAYFDRVVDANDNFREPGTAGWQTDRGEVYITLGPPSEVQEVRSLRGLGASAFRWTYDEYQLALDFVVDQGGFGRFTLTAASRQALDRFLTRLMREGQ
jgi:GWxTD domain-containing protein